MAYTPNQYAVGQGEIARRGVMSQVYAWMTAGLLTTGAVALFTSRSDALLSLIFGTPLYFVLLIAQIAVVWFLSARVGKMSPGAATATFLGYSALNGLTMAAIFLVYTNESVASTFFITGGMFGVMSLIGYVTKRDLSGMGNILFMALIGFVIASIVNLFFQNSALYWILTYAGVALFTGLTIYDTQMIKRMAAGVNNSSDAQRVAIIGALKLYPDFINLFLLLLRIFGNRR